MRKSISILLCFSLLSCLSLNLYSQSAENELDQVELMKQYNGKWAAVAGKDSTWLWEITPSNKGYVHVLYLEVKGKTVETLQGIFGFADEYKKTNLLILYQDGFISRDIGGFVSDNKCIMERFYPQDEKTGLGTWEVTFLTPDKFTAIWKVKGVKKGELIYIRVKE
jgi:hypothetical protein